MRGLGVVFILIAFAAYMITPLVGFLLGLFGFVLEVAGWMLVIFGKTSDLQDLDN